MRILMVGHSKDKSGGISFYNTENKLRNGFVRNNHNVYLFNAREFARSRTLFRSAKLGQIAADREFNNLVQSFRPDLVVFMYSCNVTNRAFELARAQNPKIKFAQICQDALYKHENFARVKSRASFCHATFVTTAGSILSEFRIDNNVSAFIPNPVDRSVETFRGFERHDQNYHVFWAARAHVGEFDTDPRLTFPKRLLAEHDIRLSYHGILGRSPLFGAEYYEALADAKMGLNILADRLGRARSPASKSEIYLTSSARLAQIMGSGLLAISRRNTALNELFKEDSEMVFADCEDELVEKVRYYVVNDDQRKDIAKKGWARSMHDFNEQIVARFIEDVTFRNSMSIKYNWPTTLY